MSSAAGKVVVLKGEAAADPARLCAGRSPPLEAIALRLNRLLPPGVLAAAVVDCGAAGIPLHPDEAALLSPSAVPKRRADFAAGRAAARLALTHAGFRRSPALTVGARGEPRWPTGWVGSISHSRGIAIAAVARSGDMLAVGIDVEGRHDASPGIADAVATRRELKWLSLETPGWRTRLSLLFSAKECLYKALYPALGLELDFLDVELTWDGRFRSFRPEFVTPGLEPPPAWAPLTVRAEIVGAVVLTATCCPTP